MEYHPADAQVPALRRGPESQLWRGDPDGAGAESHDNGDVERMNPDPEYEPQTSDAYGDNVVCEACGGVGHDDSGAFTPWGQAIEWVCEECEGTGEIRHT